MLHALGDPAYSSGVVYALLDCIFQELICDICQFLHVKLIYVHENVPLSSVVQQNMVIEISWHKIPVVPTCINLLIGNAKMEFCKNKKWFLSI